MCASRYGTSKLLDSDLYQWEGKYDFLRLTYKAPVTVDGRRFRSVAHALTFASIDPTYSFKKGALDKLYQKVTVTKASKLRSTFEDYPVRNEWHTQLARPILFELLRQKFKDPVLRNKLKQIRGRRFIYQSKDLYLGAIISNDKVNGKNLIGHMISVVRNYLLTRYVVVITGGRDYEDSQMVFRVLDCWDSTYPIEIFVNGGANGADRHGKNWAVLNKKDVRTVKAKWEDLTAPGAKVKVGEYGPYNANAGSARNLEMIDLVKSMETATRIPVCMSFPGGNGTAHMTKACLDNDVITFRLDPVERKMRLLDKGGNEHPFVLDPCKKLNGDFWWDV